MIGLVLVTGCVILEAGRELCFKQSAGALATAAGARDWHGLARPSLVWLGIALWAAELPLWVLTLQYLPLTIAFPLMAASFAVVPLAGWLILHERLTRAHMTGIVLVASGVACVGLAGV